jgi:hypothetical protein
MREWVLAAWYICVKYGIEFAKSLRLNWNWQSIITGPLFKKKEAWQALLTPP